MRFCHFTLNCKVSQWCHRLTKTLGHTQSHKHGMDGWMDGWAGLHGLWRMKVIGRKAILILLLYWALKCRGANVFTVNASGLASDLGFMWTQMWMFYKRKYAYLCLHRRVQNLQPCRINSNSSYGFFLLFFLKDNKRKWCTVPPPHKTLKVLLFTHLLDLWSLFVPTFSFFKILFTHYSGFN